jgi:hypothetical protein
VALLKKMASDLPLFIFEIVSSRLSEQAPKVKQGSRETLYWSPSYILNFLCEKKILQRSQKHSKLKLNTNILLDTFLEAVGRGEVKRSNMKAVTTKAIYTSRMKDLLIPPKAKLKFPQVNFKEIVYPRLRNQVLEIKHRDLLFSLTHSIYCNRERLFQQNKADDNLCQNPACRRENLVQYIEHLFCTCYKVRAAWQWTMGKMLELLRDQGRTPDIQNMDLILAMFPKSRQEEQWTVIMLEGKLYLFVHLIKIV